LILYEMLSGRRAFSGDSAVETMSAILKTDPPTLPDAPAALQRIVQHCLERNPGERFQSAHDLAFDLEAALESSTERPQTPRRPRRWRWAAAVAGILATATLGWFAWRQSAAPALSFNERDVVLVGAVENATDDPVLEGTLTMALRIALEQSPYVTLLPPTRVRGALQRMRRPPDEKLTEELAREICVREGVRALLAGAVASTGGEFVLTVRIVNPSSGASVRTASARAASKETILSAVDELASTLRVDLGESLSSIAETSRALADATTSSIEALRAYTEGVQLNARGRRSEAEACSGAPSSWIPTSRAPTPHWRQPTVGSAW
jgi:eukaryotic-like serine/threonine-protein kinase